MPPASFDIELSNNDPPPLLPILPFVRRAPRIYNVHLDDNVGPSFVARDENTFELMIWDCRAPRDPADLEAYGRCLCGFEDLRSIATFGNDSDPLGDLISCSRGWNIHRGQHTQTLVSLFQWMSDECETRFKDPHRQSNFTTSQFSESHNGLYERYFLAALRTMKEKGWIGPNEYLRFRLEHSRAASLIWGRDIEKQMSRLMASEFGSTDAVDSSTCPMLSEMKLVDTSSSHSSF